MAKKNSRPQRIDAKLEFNLLEVMSVRRKKGLMSRKEETFPEITRLLGRTEGFKMSMEELKNKPKRIEIK